MLAWHLARGSKICHFAIRTDEIICNRDCILEHVGDEAKPIAHEVGIVLARKLDELSPTARKNAAVQKDEPMPLPPGSLAATGCVGMSTACAIVLTGFDPDDIAYIEQTLMAFKGYEHHRPVRTQTRFVEYWYETCADHARLERNLRVMLDQMPVQTRVALTGNRFELERIPGAGQRRPQDRAEPIK
jgi:hypothetical protein